MKIIADTATLLSPAEGEKLGVTVIPVGVLIDGDAYRDYEEITTAEFLERIQRGGIPKSSQPSVGDVLEVFESSGDEMLFITVGDGLSGGYQTAMGARNCIEDNERIHVVNSKTLAGPMRYLVKKAVALRDQGLELPAIKEELQRSIESSVSFVIPEDFEFLKRSGRLTPLAAKIGGALRLLPVLTQSKDKTRIAPVSVKRTWKSAVAAIIQRLQEIGVDDGYLVSVSHAGTPEKGATILECIREEFPAVEMELLELSPALATHGGPGCIVVQAIMK